MIIQFPVPVTIDRYAECCFDIEIQFDLENKLQGSMIENTNIFFWQNVFETVYKMTVFFVPGIMVT